MGIIGNLNKRRWSELENILALNIHKMLLLLDAVMACNCLEQP